ncbi:MAG: DUF3656 domain-containing protein, partial [Clostridia bacterium]|nr:DUF3656 domain-containing protein [Clostridia bacterium]
GRPAVLEVSDGAHTARASGDIVEAATGRGFDAERATAQLQRTGGTAYVMAEVAVDADANAFCPVSLLNALRREALAALEAQRTAVNHADEPYAAQALPRDELDKPLLMAQSADVRQLEAALDSGADMAVFAPADVRPAALDKIDLAALSRKGRVALAVPAVLCAEALDVLNAWALENGRYIKMTFLSNVGQLGMEWPGARAGDYLLNVGNNAAAAQLRDWGMAMYTPSVELNAGQIGRLGGRTNLIMWGRLPLMHLRHCPLRAAEGMEGRHADCRHCDGREPAARLEGRALVDRKGVAFPLKRLAEDGSGCVVQLLNSAPLMPLRKAAKLPNTSGWRLLMNPDEPTEAVVRVYRAALDGRDFRALPEWKAIDAMNTTTGHYFRGVE